MNQAIRYAMRYGSPDQATVQAYQLANDPLIPNLCARTFTLNIGNGFVDPSMNTMQGLRDVEVCEQFLRNYCYRQFHGGQMEQVLDDMVCVSFIKTPREVMSIVRELRKLGIKGKIYLSVEYVEGFPVEVKNY
jgi:hypothetical protein